MNTRERISSNASAFLPRHIGTRIRENPALTKKAGFSLIELIVALAIVAILVAMAVPAYQMTIDTAKVARAKGEIRTIEKGIVAFYLETGKFPTGLDEVNYDTLRDPWHHLYVYHRTGGGLSRYVIDPAAALNPASFDLYSVGFDGDSDADVIDQKSQDDVIRTGDGGFVGLGRHIAPAP